MPLHLPYHLTVDHSDHPNHDLDLPAVLLGSLQHHLHLARLPDPPDPIPGPLVLLVMIVLASSSKTLGPQGEGEVEARVHTVGEVEVVGSVGRGGERRKGEGK